MSSSTGALSLPRRISLAEQTVHAIRTAIDNGLWTDRIPSERRLCETFHVSRPTVRAALDRLGKQGILKISQGRSTLIAARPRGGRRTRKRLVAIIAHEPIPNLSASSFQGISEMRTHLAEHDIATEVFVCQGRSGAAQLRKLDSFVREHSISCSALVSVSRELQRWFETNRLAALVIGSCHPGIHLPSLDVDFRSVCRHAAGVFLRNGHRSMALVVPDSGHAGDLASESGFLEAAESWSGRESVCATVVRHSGSAQNIGSRLDSLFRSARAPTALLVAKPQHVFVVILYLLTRGIAVPGAVSLLARDQDHLFTTVSPPISHYGSMGDAFNRRLTRLMLQMVGAGTLPPKPNLIFPQLVAGGTVASPRTA